MPRLLPILALLVAAAVLRFHDLPTRVMHTDEAVHAVKVGRMLEGSPFHYDPSDFHGPTLHDLTLLVARARGQWHFSQLDESTLRGVTAFFGVLLILTPFAFRKELGGDAPAVIAAWLTVISPIMVFYSRYYIMEMLFIAFLALLALAFWRWSQGGKAWWLVLAAVALGLLHATKETFVIHVAAMAFAATMADGRRSLRKIFPFLKRHAFVLTLTAAGGFLVSAALLSHGFQRPEAILDGARTYLLYFERAEGVDAGHQHPWYFYFTTLFGVTPVGGVLYSAIGVLALALWGGVRAFLPCAEEDDSSRSFLRMLALYTLVTALAYSLIPYKTPWSFLGTCHGMLLLAGSALGSLVPKPGEARTPKRLVAAATGAILLAACTTHDLLEVKSLVIDAPGDPAQPYVYGHTSPEFLDLVEDIETLQKIEGRPLELVMVNEDRGWPMPWYRRHSLGHNHYGTALPALDPTPDVLATSTLHFPEAAQHLLATHIQKPYVLRPGLKLHVFFRKSLTGLRPKSPSVIKAPEDPQE